MTFCASKMESKRATMDLCTACGLGLAEFVRAEMKRNPRSILKPNEKGWTPIMYACVYSRPEIVSLIATRFPSSVYAVNNEGQTPLMLATKAGDLDLVRILSKRSLLNRKDERGWTALFYAVYYGQEDIIHHLIRCGADVNARDHEQKSVLMTAIESRQEGAIELLIASGARYDSKLDYIDADELHLGHFQLFLLLSIASVTDLDNFLQIQGLSEYCEFFRDKRIHLNDFLELNESDLKQIGVDKLGPRRKMALAIQKYNYLKNLSKQLRNNSYKYK